MPLPGLRGGPHQAALRWRCGPLEQHAVADGGRREDQGPRGEGALQGRNPAPLTHPAVSGGTGSAPDSQFEIDA
jgi:hypothetical protein